MCRTYNTAVDILHRRSIFHEPPRMERPQVVPQDSSELSPGAQDHSAVLVVMIARRWRVSCCGQAGGQVLHQYTQSNDMSRCSSSSDRAPSRCIFIRRILYHGWNHLSAGEPYTCLMVRVLVPGTAEYGWKVLEECHGSVSAALFTFRFIHPAGRPDEAK